MRIVCQHTILMKYHALFVIFENVGKFEIVVCCKLYVVLYGLSGIFQIRICQCICRYAIFCDKLHLSIRNQNLFGLLWMTKNIIVLSQ